MKKIGQQQRYCYFTSSKGSETVILNRDNYIKKLFDIISDTSKFKKLPADPTLLREKIRKLNLQRNNLSLRPIVSSIGSSNYHLSKFLTDLLHPIILTCHWTNYSFMFCEEIMKVSHNNRFLIFYDFCSLFTGIPLK